MYETVEVEGCGTMFYRQGNRVAYFEGDPRKSPCFAHRPGPSIQRKQFLGEMRFRLCLLRLVLHSFYILLYPFLCIAYKLFYCW